jgi:hypothetical protein
MCQAWKSAHRSSSTVYKIGHFKTGFNFWGAHVRLLAIFIIPTAGSHCMLDIIAGTHRPCKMKTSQQAVNYKVRGQRDPGRRRENAETSPIFGIY